MIPGQRNAAGQLFTLPGPAPVGSPFRAGVANSNDGQVYISDGAASWTPTELFLGGEQGCWYDPSDMSTMFQDAAGTISVTAAGQPVGLVLDKSKGLSLGPELVPDPSFDNPSAWTPQDSNWTVSGGKASYADGGLSYLRSNADIAITAGKWYVVSFTMSSGTPQPAMAVIGMFDKASSVNYFGSYLEFSTNGAKTAYFYATTSTTGINIYGNNSGMSSWALDSFSIKELAGNHASQATAAARPLLTATGIAKWNDFDAVDDVLDTTFQSSLGSNCTVALANVGAAPTILTGQTIGTSYAQSVDNAGLVIIDRALTAQETTDLTAYLLAKGATS